MKTINLIVPRGWHELDDKQLRHFFGLLADDYTSAEIRTLCLVRFARLGGTSPKPKKSSFWSRFAPKVRWSGLQVIFRHKSDFVFRLGKDDFKLSATVVADIIQALKWLDEIPSFPVILSRIGQYTARHRISFLSHSRNISIATTSIKAISIRKMSNLQHIISRKHTIIDCIYVGIKTINWKNCY